MLNIEFLQNMLFELPEITDNSQVIESDAGYDGIIEIIKARSSLFPVIVLEDSAIGSLEVTPSGLDNTTQSLWIMEKVGNNETKRDFQRSAFILVKKIIAKMLRNRRSPELSGWDFGSIPYMVRNAGENTGYEVVIYFKEYIDLSNG